MEFNLFVTKDVKSNVRICILIFCALVRKILNWKVKNFKEYNALCTKISKQRKKKKMTKTKEEGKNW